VVLLEELCSGCRTFHDGPVEHACVSVCGQSFNNLKQRVEVRKKRLIGDGYIWSLTIRGGQKMVDVHPIRDCPWIRRDTNLRGAPQTCLKSTESWNYDLLSAAYTFSGGETNKT